MTIQGRFVKRLRNTYSVPVRTRREWGTNHASVYFRRLVTHPARRRVDTVVQHITVTHDTGRLVGHFNRDMQLVERIGWERFGSGFSYNLAVDMQTGMVGIGMPFYAKGTHTVNDKNVPGYSRDQNLMARAIALLGMPGDAMSGACRRSIVAILACGMDLGLWTEDPDYVPHSLFAFKDCPTNAIRPDMPAILRDAKALHRKMSNE